LLANQTFFHKPLNISFKAIPKQILLDCMVSFQKYRVPSY
jgi:hypothetical protein